MPMIVKQILLAMLMGVLLPQILLRLGDKPLSTAGEVIQEETLPAEEQMYLAVQTGTQTIQIMELENYVLGVVLAEMPAGFESEALKAQAVVVRTYALRRFIMADRHVGAAVCTDPTCCQAYITEAAYLLERGSQNDLQKVSAAVKATAGVVLTYDKELIEATYFSCSGGRTEDAVEVWGTEIPYLQAVDSPGEEHADIYQSSVTFSASEFAAALGRTMEGSADQWFGRVTHTTGGGVDNMVIGGISYSGVELRRLLGLYSTAFSVRTEGSNIIVDTLGKGHRVGMSQYGADAMAALGNSYDQILLYYYRGTTIDKWDNLG